MISNYHKQIYKNQGCHTKMSTTESRLARTLAIDSADENDDNDVSIHEKKVVLKAPRTSWKLQNTQKLSTMMAKLKKDITVVMNYGGRGNEEISKHRIFLRLDLLNTYIEQVIYIKDVIKRGGTIFPESLFVMQKKTNDTLNKIREEIFKVYLELETEDKYKIARQGGQMTCIFTLLGIIERELYSTYAKISQAIDKRNEHRNKNNKGATELFATFRSLPTLKSSKQKSKERLTYNQKNNNRENYINNSEPDHIPSKKQIASKNIVYDHPIKHQVTEITKNTDLVDNILKESTDSRLRNLEEDNYCVVQQNSDNELYEDCTGPEELENQEYKATSFEINISDENIQIKIPTSVIYLVRNSNYNSFSKNDIDQDKNSENRRSVETCFSCSYPSSKCSVCNLHMEKTISDESISSLYTDIITDSEVGIESKKKSYNSKKRSKFINHGKCMPFFSENCYCNSFSKENESMKSIHSTEIKVDKEGIEKCTEKGHVFPVVKKNGNLTSEYQNNICSLGNPLFGNILQLVDLIKKIYCNCNDKTIFGCNENLEIVSNIDETSSLTSTLLRRYNDCPPSISQSSFECSSLWKESASRLCELCPGCVSFVKLS